MLAFVLFLFILVTVLFMKLYLLEIYNEEKGPRYMYQAR
jgi:hypothetical protein